MNESLIVFGGVYFDQYASDFDEHSWKTCDNGQKSHIVFRGVHFDKNASSFEEHSWKTLDN